MGSPGAQMLRPPSNHFAVSAPYDRRHQLPDSHLKYRPLSTQIVAPVLAIYGDYDTECPDAQVAAYLDRFTASRLKWRLQIAHGTHAMHLEKGRFCLYEGVDAFIRAAERLTARAGPT
jgi:pimeloyl-ACP methyl ester carboxylesterase